MRLGIHVHWPKRYLKAPPGLYKANHLTPFSKARIRTQSVDSLSLLPFRSLHLSFKSLQPSTYPIPFSSPSLIQPFSNCFYTTRSMDGSDHHLEDQQILSYFEKKSILSQPKTQLGLKKVQSMLKSSANSSMDRHRKGKLKPQKSQLEEDPMGSTINHQGIGKWKVHDPFGQEEENMRVDRWFRHHYQHIPYSHLLRMLRTKKIKIRHHESNSWSRVQSNDRLSIGCQLSVWIGPGGDQPTFEHKMVSKGKALALSSEHIMLIRSWILFKDRSLIVLNKPTDLAVQGGTGIWQSLDDWLPALQYDHPQVPRLVHRLDQGATGLLLLARDRVTAQALIEGFRDHKIAKLYWAVCIGTPKTLCGSVRVHLDKYRSPDDGEEKIHVVDQDQSTNSMSGEYAHPLPIRAKPSFTRYHTIGHLHSLVSVLALRPLTGRTHQLRVHCAKVLGTPIYGDSKYGDLAQHTTIKELMLDFTDTKHRSEQSLMGTLTKSKNMAKKPKHDQFPNLHLHAREIAFQHPTSKRNFHFIAPLPSYMQRTLSHLEVDIMIASHPYAQLTESERQLEPYKFEFRENVADRRNRLRKFKRTSGKRRRAMAKTRPSRRPTTSHHPQREKKSNSDSISGPSTENDFKSKGIRRRYPSSQSTSSKENGENRKKHKAPSRKRI